MSLILTLIGLGFVLYALYLMYGSSKTKSSESFDGEEFIKEVESFSKVLEEKQEKDIDMKHKENTIKEETSYNKSKALFKDVSKNRNINNDMVISLYNKGNSVNKIAKETGKSIREIEVILKMYNNK